MEGENYGKLRFQSPTFSYGGRSFSATGAYEVVEPLRLPLTPIRSALAGAGLQAAADALPDAVPVVEIDLVDDQNRLNAEGLMALLKQTGLSDELRDGLAGAVAATDQFLARTPGRFNDFLSAALPQRLDWDIEIAPGGVRLDVSTGPEDDPSRPPIRVLLPTVDPIFGPELMGIELKGVRFGAMLSGSMSALGLDARIEHFDLITLLQCQLSGGTSLDGQPARQVHRRHCFDRVLALMPTAAPVPIPVFYDGLGLSYRGWDGISLESHWRFPEPEVGFLEAIDLIRATYRFVAEKEFLFDPAAPAPGGLDLPFAIGPNRIGLPEHLGGGALGSAAATEGAIWPSIANVLDGLKTGQPRYFLNAIPVEARTGALDSRLGPFGLRSGVALTTPAEFAGADGAAVRAVLQGVIGKDPDSLLLEVLQRAGSGAEGAVLLAFGGFDIAEVIRFDGGFALATLAGSGDDGAVSGVGTVVRFSGGIGALGFLIEGGLGAGSDGVWIELGGSPLVVNGASLIESRGRMEVGPAGWRVKVLFSPSLRFSLDGDWFIGPEAMEIGGALLWRYAEDRSLEGDTIARFSGDGAEMGFGGTLFASEARIIARLGSDGTAGAAMDLVIPTAFQEAFRGQLVGVADRAEGAVATALSDLEAKIAALEFEISLRGIRAGLPALCDRIIGEITSGIRNAINSNWPSRFGVTAPGRQAAIDAGLAQARPSIDRLARLRDAARQEDDAGLRAALRAALLDVIDNNHLTVRIPFPSVRVTWTWLGPRVRFPERDRTIYSRDLMNASQIAQLRTGIEAVDAIPAREGPRVEAQQVYEKAVNRKAILADIRSGIESGVEANVPVIEAIGFSSSLELIETAPTVTARLRHQGEEKILSADFDLTDPVGSMESLARAFGDSLG